MEPTTGNARGGRARQASMTPEQRKEAARKAALAKAEIAKLPRATHGGEDHPLKIGEIEIPCYVLEDGRRVLAQRGMVTALGMSRGGSSKGGGDRLAHFVTGKALEPFIGADLRAVRNRARQPFLGVTRGEVVHDSAPVAGLHPRDQRDGTPDVRAGLDVGEVAGDGRGMGWLLRWVGIGVGIMSINHLASPER